MVVVYNPEYQTPGFILPTPLISLIGVIIDEQHIYGRLAFTRHDIQIHHVPADLLEKAVKVRAGQPVPNLQTNSGLFEETHDEEQAKYALALAQLHPVDFNKLTSQGTRPSLTARLAIGHARRASRALETPFTLIERAAKYIADVIAHANMEFIDGLPRRLRPPPPEHMWEEAGLASYLLIALCAFSFVGHDFELACLLPVGFEIMRVAVASQIRTHSMPTIAHGVEWHRSLNIAVFSFAWSVIFVAVPLKVTRWPELYIALLNAATFYELCQITALVYYAIMDDTVLNFNHLANPAPPVQAPQQTGIQRILQRTMAAFADDDPPPAPAPGVAAPAPAAGAAPAKRPASAGSAVKKVVAKVFIAIGASVFTADLMQNLTCVVLFNFHSYAKQVHNSETMGFVLQQTMPMGDARGRPLTQISHPYIRGDHLARFNKCIETWSAPGCESMCILSCIIPTGIDHILSADSARSDVRYRKALVSIQSGRYGDANNDVLNHPTTKILEDILKDTKVGIWQKNGRLFPNAEAAEDFRDQCRQLRDFLKKTVKYISLNNTTLNDLNTDPGTVGRIQSIKLQAPLKPDPPPPSRIGGYAVQAPKVFSAAIFTLLFFSDARNQPSRHHYFTHLKLKDPRPLFGFNITESDALPDGFVDSVIACASGHAPLTSGELAERFGTNKARFTADDAVEHFQVYQFLCSESKFTGLPACIPTTAEDDKPSPCTKDFQKFRAGLYHIREDPQSRTWRSVIYDWHARAIFLALVPPLNDVALYGWYAAQFFGEALTATTGAGSGALNTLVATTAMGGPSLLNNYIVSVMGETAMSQMPMQQKLLVLLGDRSLTVAIATLVYKVFSIIHAWLPRSLEERESQSLRFAQLQDWYIANVSRRGLRLIQLDSDGNKIYYTSEQLNSIIWSRPTYDITMFLSLVYLNQLCHDFLSSEFAEDYMVADYRGVAFQKLFIVQYAALHRAIYVLLHVWGGPGWPRSS